MFNLRDNIWEEMERNGAFQALRQSSIAEFRELPDKLRGLWDGLAAVHAAVDRHNPDLLNLQPVVAELGVVQQWFYGNKVRPFRSTEKWYDHAVQHHIISQMRGLQAKGMSLVAVSSRFLEHLNKTVKGIASKLPGGGVKRANYAEEAVVQTYKKLFAVCVSAKEGVLRKMRKEAAARVARAEAQE